MKFGVLAPSDSWHYRDLCRAGEDERCELVSVAYSRLVASLPDSVVRSADQDLRSLDALLTRAMPAGSLEQVVFRMDAIWVAEQQGLFCINSPKAVEASVDKYLSLVRLSGAGLPVPETLVCENHRDVGDAFDRLGADVVMKPIFGSEGRGLVRIQDRELAERYYRFIEGIGGVLYLQRFIDFGGEDIRVLVIGESCLGMRRRGVKDWRNNISQGGVAEPLVVDDELTALALAAAQSVGAEFAGIDIGRAVDGRLYILEVNAAPGWRRISQILNIDVARQLLQHIRRRVTET
jgi:ribosomal protein S6--L-glutamate ligase